EGVETVEARRIEGFGEDQCQQDRHRPGDLAARKVAALYRLAGAGPGGAGMLSAVPVSDAEEDGHREQCGRGEPGDARLAPRDDDKGGEDRPQRGADVAADLEQRLRQTVPP